MSRFIPTARERTLKRLKTQYSMRADVEIPVPANKKLADAVFKAIEGEKALDIPVTSLYTAARKTGSTSSGSVSSSSSSSGMKRATLSSYGEVAIINRGSKLYQHDAGEYTGIRTRPIARVAEEIWVMALGDSVYVHIWKKGARARRTHVTYVQPDAQTALCGVSGIVPLGGGAGGSSSMFLHGIQLRPALLDVETHRLVPFRRRDTTDESGAATGYLSGASLLNDGSGRTVLASSVTGSVHILDTRENKHESVFFVDSDSTLYDIDVHPAGHLIAVAATRRDPLWYEAGAQYDMSATSRINIEKSSEASHELLMFDLRAMRANSSSEPLGMLQRELSPFRVRWAPSTEQTVFASLERGERQMAQVYRMNDDASISIIDLNSEQETEHVATAGRDTSISWLDTRNLDGASRRSPQLWVGSASTECAVHIWAFDPDLAETVAYSCSGTNVHAKAVRLNQSTLPPGKFETNAEIYVDATMESLDNHITMVSIVGETYHGRQHLSVVK